MIYVYDVLLLYALQRLPYLAGGQLLLAMRGQGGCGFGERPSGRRL